METDTPNVIALPPLILLAHLVLGLLLQFIWPVRLLSNPALAWIGAILIVVSILIGIAATLAFRKARTALDPRKPTTTIITGGIFGVSRNPIYLSMILVFVGIALLLNSAWLLLLVVPFAIILRMGVIEREERYLQSKFGEDYRVYKTRVRRWI